MGGACSWGTQARPSGAPKQAAEAMPSSRGDARAAERARTGVAKGPRRGQRISTPWMQSVCVCVCVQGGWKFYFNQELSEAISLFFGDLTTNCQGSRWTAV
jgi:hypothetical protein